MSKKLNIDSITNELEGSAFFPQKKVAPESPTPSKIITKPSSEKVVSINKPTQPNSYPQQNPVPHTVPPSTHLIPKVKRPIKQRQPFDIYEDQYETLKKITESEKDFVNGRKMSQMVREAIDTYLKDHDTTK